MKRRRALRRYISAFVAVLAFGGCRKLHRYYNLDLGPSVDTSTDADSAVFERRQGIFLGVSGADLQDFANNLRTGLDGKDVVSKGGAKPSVSSLAGFKFEQSVKATHIHICLSQVAIAASGAGPMALTLSMHLCGIVVTADGINATLHLPGPGLSPLAMTIAHLGLSNQNAATDLEAQADFGVDESGDLVTRKVKILKGIEALSDPSQYTMDLAMTGTEQALGGLGHSMQELREDMVTEILQALQGYTSSMLEDLAVKSTNQALVALNRKKIGHSGSGFYGEAGGVNFAGVSRLRGFLGETGLGMSMEMTMRLGVEAWSQKLPCQIQFTQAPSADPVPLNTFNLSYGFSKSQTTTDQTATDRVHGRVFLPQSFINALLWQVFGNQGSCQFRLGSADQDQNASLGLHYTSPVAVTLEPLPPPADQNEGALVRIHFSGAALQLPAKLMQDLIARGKLTANDLKPLSQVGDHFEAPLPSATYPLRLDLAASKIHLGVVNEARYKDAPTAPGIDPVKLLEDVAQAAEPDSDDKIQQLFQAALRSALDQELGPLLASRSLSLESPTAPTADAIGVDNDSLYLSFSHALPPLTETATTGSALDLLAPAQVNDSQLRAKLAALGLPVLVGLSQEAAVAAIGGPQGPDSSGWTCTTRPMAASIPLGQEVAFLSYADCAFAGETSLELRWQFSAVPNPAAVSTPPVNFMRLRALRPIAYQHLPVLNFDALKQGLGEPSEVTLGQGSFGAKWLSSELTLAARVFCWPATSACKPMDGSNQQVTELELWSQ